MNRVKNIIKRRKFTPEYETRLVLEIWTVGKGISVAKREYGFKDTVMS